MADGGWCWLLPLMAFVGDNRQLQADVDKYGLILTRSWLMITDDGPIMHDNTIYWRVAEKMSWKMRCDERCWMMTDSCGRWWLMMGVARHMRTGGGCERMPRIVEENDDEWSKDDVWWRMKHSAKERVTIVDAWCRLILDDEQGWSMMMDGHELLAGDPRIDDGCSICNSCMADELTENGWCMVVVWCEGDGRWSMDIMAYDGRWCVLLDHGAECYEACWCMMRYDDRW